MTVNLATESKMSVDDAVTELLAKEFHTAIERVVNRMAEATIAKNKDHTQLEVFEEVAKVFNEPMKRHGIFCYAERVNRHLRIVVSLEKRR